MRTRRRRRQHHPQKTASPLLWAGVVFSLHSSSFLSGAVCSIFFLGGDVFPPFSAPFVLLSSGAVFGSNEVKRREGVDPAGIWVVCCPKDLQDYLDM